jgi:hypothetical protein
VEYELRGVLPDWSELQNERRHKAQLAGYHAMKGKLPVLIRTDAEEFVNRDWLEPIGARDCCLIKLRKWFA